MAPFSISKRIISGAVASALGATVISANANEAQNNTADNEIERVSVWSTAVNTSSLYLNEGDISNKQADHISDLLRTIPGVDVGGAHSLNQRITIRSMDDKDLKISIDGAAQNTYMYHHMGNLQIHADILKSVDIEIGTNSVVNGGLGGAVKFETKQAQELLNANEQIGGRIHVSAGDNSGTNYSLTGYGLLADNVDFLAYYNYVDRKNYDVGGNQIKDASGAEIEGTDGEVKGLEGTTTDALIKLGWDINNNQRLAFSYESYKDEGDYSYRPDMGLATDLAITNSLAIPLLWPTEFTRDTLTLNYTLHWSDYSMLKASVFSNTSELWRDELGWAENESFASSAGIITGEAKNTGVNILANTLISNSVEHDITYGLDIVKHETHYYADYTTIDDAVSAEEATTTALFIQDKIAISPSFAIIPGARYEHYDIDSTLVDNTFNETSFALAAEYSPTEQLIFKLSSTQIFKAPEIAEVFIGAGLYDEANPDIKAETGTNSEFSFAYQTRIKDDDQLSLGATLFKTSINDYIYDYASGSLKDNIGDMEIDGFEAYLGYKLNGFNSQITYSSAESELDAFDQYDALNGARLDRQQGDTLTVSADYVFSAVDLTLHWELMNVDDVDAGVDLDGATLNNEKDGFTVHNISLNWQPQSQPQINIVFGVDNLFDEYYASQSSRTGTSFHPRFGELYLLDYEPGRNIKATFAYQF
ncbi:Heme transporter BhuA precursor [Pseudoalteromonas sp. P1-13-1a]|uniref:TonB-dependent receptor domain-containing protein n=1 Tax=Pseudoalteromonas sp. P1-13-1a TaxID=1723756 RepID=UPI0006D658D6|nr:TonB-dependent receptor [Pseudoalteromonas sp. P1-13-1a]KPZ57350.1 Heme transporter BhuA precursor [Pseudoalteromonas sp. P1-13-1a]